MCACGPVLRVVLPTQLSDVKSFSAGLVMLRGYLSMPVRHAASAEG